MATHSSILAWETPWAEEPGGLQSMESQKSRTRLSDQKHRHHLTSTMSVFKVLNLIYVSIIREQGK